MSTSSVGSVVPIPNFPDDERYTFAKPEPVIIKLCFPGISEWSCLNITDAESNGVASGSLSPAVYISIDSE